jgi:hypothetical protein
MNRLSRREFFQFVTQPIRRSIQRVEASEKRAQAIAALTRADSCAQEKCARCYARFRSEAGEIICPACRDAEAKNHDLMQSLFKAP